MPVKNVAPRQVGVLGSGTVGETLAGGFLQFGYDVMRGSRAPDKLAAWKEKAGPRAQVGSFADAARFGDIVVLAVKGAAAASAVTQAGIEALAGKTVIDTTNPIADKPPEHGVLRFFTNLDESLHERLQKQAPKANFVKAFSCVGAGMMVQPRFAQGKPTMFICGNDSKAKQQVTAVLDQFGWDT